MCPPDVPFTCTEAVLLPSVAIPIVQPIGYAVVDGRVTDMNGCGLLTLEITLLLLEPVAASELSAGKLQWLIPAEPIMPITCAVAGVASRTRKIPLLSYCNTMNS